MENKIELIDYEEKYADVIIEADGFEVEDTVEAIINAVSK